MTDTFPTKLNALTKNAKKFLGNQRTAVNSYKAYGTNSNNNTSFIIDQNAKQLLLFFYIEQFKNSDLDDSKLNQKTQLLLKIIIFADVADGATSTKKR